MANVYTQTLISNEPTATPTEVVRVYWCDVATQLDITTLINFSWTTAAAACIDVFAFSNGASGAAASSTTGKSTGNTSPGSASGALSAGNAGDILLFSVCSNDTPSFTGPLDNSGGAAMTALTVSPQAGQSRSAYTAYRVETAGAAWTPRVTLGSSQEWSCGAARWNNNGSTAALIASSAASSGWQPSATTGSVSPGATIPVGSKLFVVFYAASASSNFVISDTAGGVVAPGVRPFNAIPFSPRPSRPS